MLTFWAVAYIERPKTFIGFVEPTVSQKSGVCFNQGTANHGVWEEIFLTP